MCHRNIEKLGQLRDGDGGDVAVVCVTLYFMRMNFYRVNAKEVPWEEITIDNLYSLLWFNRFDRFTETMKINQRNMMAENIGMLYLFP